MGGRNSIGATELVMAPQSAVACAADKMLGTDSVTAKGMMCKTVTRDATWAAVKVSATATTAAPAAKSRCVDSYPQRAEGNARTKPHDCPYSHDVPPKRTDFLHRAGSECEVRRNEVRRRRPHLLGSGGFWWSNCNTAALSCALSMLHDSVCFADRGLPVSKILQGWSHLPGSSVWIFTGRPQEGTGPRLWAAASRAAYWRHFFPLSFAPHGTSSDFL